MLKLLFAVTSGAGVESGWRVGWKAFELYDISLVAWAIFLQNENKKAKSKKQ